MAPVRRGDEGGGPGRRERGRVLGRRRRRLDPGAERARARRPGVMGVDRRRRGARAARGQGAAGRGGDPGRMKLIAGNWKMFKGLRETREFCAAFTAPEGVQAVVCPPFVSLAAAVESGHTVFAQNVHWAADGAYTGEISAPMLQELGVAGS